MQYRAQSLQLKLIRGRSDGGLVGLHPVSKATAAPSAMDPTRIACGLDIGSSSPSWAGPRASGIRGHLHRLPGGGCGPHPPGVKWVERHGQPEWAKWLFWDRANARINGCATADGSSATGVEAGAGGPGRDVGISLDRRGAGAVRRYHRNKLAGTDHRDKLTGTAHRNRREPALFGRVSGSDRWVARRCPPGRMLFSSVQQ